MFLPKYLDSSNDKDDGKYKNYIISSRPTQTASRMHDDIFLVSPLTYRQRIMTFQSEKDCFSRKMYKFNEEIVIYEGIYRTVKEFQKICESIPINFE